MSAVITTPSISILLYLPVIPADSLQQYFLRFPETEHLDFVDAPDGSVAITAYRLEGERRSEALRFSLRFLKENEITMH